VRRFSVPAVIPAPPRDVYAVLADYREGHPRILPRPPFESLDVEAGGIGAGTVIRVGMRVLGRRQSFRAVVSEPEPGRVLVERNDDGTVTTFTVEPVANGRSARVTIATELAGGRGIRGVVEQWLTPRLLRPVYVKELGLLAAVAAERGRARGEGA